MAAKRGPKYSAYVPSGCAECGDDDVLEDICTNCGAQMSPGIYEYNDLRHFDDRSART